MSVTSSGPASRASSGPASRVSAWPPEASRGYVVGEVVVEPPFAMAPMADVTDALFHEVLRGIGGPGLYTAEMVSCEALKDGAPEPERLVRRPEGCPAFAVQVYGSDPAGMAEAAVIAAERGADVVDINMGCPARALTGKACGSALLRDRPLVQSIFRAMRAALPASVPLTVKMRTGWDERSINHVEVGRMAQDEGLAAVTLHGRTRAQQFSGRSDRREIARLVRALDVPVVGNGDVQSPQDAIRLLSETGCAGVMIARGALANPWIFRQLRDVLAGREPHEPTLADRRRVILDHFARLEAELPARVALHRVRKFLGLYLRGLPDSGRLRRRLSAMADAASFRDEVEAYFAPLASPVASSPPSGARFAAGLR